MPCNILPWLLILSLYSAYQVEVIQEVTGNRYVGWPHIVRVFEGSCCFALPYTIYTLVTKLLLRFECVDIWYNWVRQGYGKSSCLYRWFFESVVFMHMLKYCIRLVVVFKNFWSWSLANGAFSFTISNIACDSTTREERCAAGFLNCICRWLIFV